jgi:hypothetical protein
MTTRPLSLPRIALVLGSLAGVAACLTAVFLGMRAVMDIGGACASGGPYVPVQPCPDGVALVLVGGIWIGVILALVYGGLTAGTGIPSFVGLFWPGLFLSLGWNFLQYAFSPPGGGGIVWGWLIPGVLFMVMGAIPLAWAIPVLTGRGSGVFGGAVNAPSAAIARLGQVVRLAPPVHDPGLVDELERLDGLHRSGAIDDAEYRAAKRRLLGGGRG